MYEYVDEVCLFWKNGWLVLIYSIDEFFDMGCYLIFGFLLVVIM